MSFFDTMIYPAFPLLACVFIFNFIFFVFGGGGGGGVQLKSDGVDGFCGTVATHFSEIFV